MNKDLLEIAAKAINLSTEKVNSDYHRLNYHLMPPVGFMNDPNGFININGEYHLFYQFNPFYPGGKKVYWGHFKSKDLVNWDSQPIALCPSEWYETHGCYSGSAVNDSGILTLMYTGNVKNSEGVRETYQCIATSSDGIYFEKNKNNPVIRNQPEGYTTHFRDPKVWKKNQLWYMVIGAQTDKEQGAVILYSSENLIEWNKIAEICSARLTELDYLGYMWECPNLFNIDGKDILIICPQGVDAKGDLYNNRYQCGYLMGSLDYINAKFEYGDFIELDRGFEFYAPQVTVDEKGRTLLSAWMGIPDEEESPTINYGWLHCLTIVRELYIKNGKLAQKPVDEMKLLRKKQTCYHNFGLRDNKVDFDEISGDSYELNCEFSWNELDEFGIELRTNESSNQKTILYYDVKNEKLVLDRNSSGEACKGIRKCSIQNTGKLRLQIFMDTSAIEIFVNDGEETFTARIYPDKESKGIKFYSKGGSLDLVVTHWVI